MVGLVFSYPSILLSSGEHASLTFSHLSDSFKIYLLTHAKSPVAKTLFYDKGKKCNYDCWLHKDLIFPILIVHDCPWHTCLELLMRWAEGRCPSAQTTDVLGCRGHVLLLVSLTLMSASWVLYDSASTEELNIKQDPDGDWTQKTFIPCLTMFNICKDVRFLWVELCPPTKFIDWGPNPQYLRSDLTGSWDLYRGNRIKIRL